MFKIMGNYDFFAKTAYQVLYHICKDADLFNSDLYALSYPDTTFWQIFGLIDY